jgi:hypothetical protein
MTATVCPGPELGRVAGAARPGAVRSCARALLADGAAVELGHVAGASRS